MIQLFISWSGDFSREVAEKLNIWIPTVIQSVNTFFSPDDIFKGETWDQKLIDELKKSDFGIVCLTPENVTAPWIHFEAGALALSLGKRLSSIMFDICASDVKGPLSRFQNTRFEKDDFYKLMQSINEIAGKSLTDDRLNYSFETAWHRLETDVNLIISKYKTLLPKEEAVKSDSEALQEILRVVRSIDNAQRSQDAIKQDY